MIEHFLSIVAVASVLAGPPDPRFTGQGPIATRLAVATPSLSSQAPPVHRAVAPARDSLKNGAIIGAIVGAVVVGLGFGTGCYAGEFMSSPGSNCNGAFFTGLAVGAGAGGLVGAGLDAMFSQSRAASTRGGLRVSWRF